MKKGKQNPKRKLIRKMLNKQKIKEKIEEYEYKHNRMNLLNGTSVEVKNIKVYNKLVIVDIILNFEDRTEKHRAVEYPLSMFEK